MAVANATIGRTGPQEPSQPWQPAVTRKEAVKLGIPSGRVRAGRSVYARTAAEEHQRLGTPRDLWEPTPIQNDQLADPFISDGEQELASRLEAEADPVLDKAQGLVENVKANLDKIAEDTEPIVAPEAGTNYSVPEAVERVGQHDVKIERDKAAGKHHHRPRQRAAPAPCDLGPVDRGGGVPHLHHYYLNVPLLEPWQDWLGWSFAATVVVVIILGQTWLVRHAARSHNHAREAYADGQPPRGGTRGSRGATGTSQGPP